MQLSSYTLVFSDTGEQDTFILYSTLFGSSIRVDGETLDRIRHVRLDPDEVDALKELGFLVESAEAEREGVRHIFQKKNELDTIFDITPVMNLDCNLDCVYCYEGRMKGHHYMTPETAARLVEFTRNNVPEQARTIQMMFYGGEPLLSRELIISISEQVGAFARETDREYRFSLVTNGTLLTPAVVEALVSLGLVAAKVTLDGPAGVHDGCRPFKGGGGSFGAIVNNISRVADMIQINLGGNFTRENYREFPKLLDHLLERGLGPERVGSVKFDPVVSLDNWNMPADFRDLGVIDTEPWIMEASLFLREEIMRRGYRTPEMGFFNCAVELRNMLVVNYDGSLYKCPGMLGKQEYRIGTLEEGIADYSRSYNLDVWKCDECLDCVYLPMCFGGCRYMTLLKDGKIERIDCRKEYYESTLEAMIKQDMKYLYGSEDE